MECSMANHDPTAITNARTATAAYGFPTSVIR